MTDDAIANDIYRRERLGFRNAWITITQLPLVYLLAGKCNVVGYLVGSSHERLNWLHRWVARTMLVTATVHGWMFFADWARYDFVQVQIKMMPMVKYGFGAWAMLVWSCLVGMAPVRRLGYEVFVLQHVISAALFLWLLYVHVPAAARYNIWFAIASWGFDRVCRVALLIWQNVKLNPDRSNCAGGQRIGHQAQLRAIGESITVVTIKDVHFRWRAGQHLYLWIPRIGPLEAHPYTIACAHKVPETCICNSIQLVVRKHGGFSKRLHEYAVQMQEKGKGKSTLTVFVSGPYGNPPRWDIYETVVLISASTGASFTLPILESYLKSGKTSCVKRVEFLLVARQGEEIGFYVGRLRELVALTRSTGVELNVQVAVTREGQEKLGEIGSGKGEKEGEPSPSSSGSNIGQHGDKGASGDEERVGQREVRRRTSEGETEEGIAYSSSRPDIAAFIRAAVEATGGETSVVACGGPSLTSRVRNCVASLSDERAVHKGTGAQGIHCFVEEYSF